MKRGFGWIVRDYGVGSTVYTLLGGSLIGVIAYEYGLIAGLAALALSAFEFGLGYGRGRRRGILATEEVYISKICSFCEHQLHFETHGQYDVCPKGNDGTV